MARLTCAAAAAGAQVIVETHSDHILNGVRLTVKRGLLPAMDVRLHYFQRHADGIIEITSPVIGSDGMLSHWPTGFFDEWDRGQPMLIHCWAGISRSTAAAYTAMCMVRPKADEEQLALELRALSPTATPNRLIVSHTDALLGRGGRMVKAVDAIGKGAEALEGTPFSFVP